MRGFEQVPWLSDALGAVTDALGLIRWRRWLMEQARGLTLELGCGTGRNLPLYAQGAQVLGLDKDARVLHRARRRAPQARLVQGRAEALPFRAGVFDTVVSSLVLCSVDDPRQALREARRVLAPGGRLRALEHVRQPGLRGRLQDLVQPAWTRLSGGCRPNRDTEAAVTAAGFRIEPASRKAGGALRRFQASVGGDGAGRGPGA